MSEQKAHRSRMYRQHIYNLWCITVPSNLIPIAALTQSIENELAWWRIETKNSAAFAAFFSPAFRPRPLDQSAALKLKIERKMSHLNNAFDRYASYRHCNALRFGNKRTGMYAILF